MGPHLLDKSEGKTGTVMLKKSSLLFELASQIKHFVSNTKVPSKNLLITLCLVSTVDGLGDKLGLKKLIID